MIRSPGVIGLVLLLLAGIARGAEEGANETDEPDGDFLEFLGSFEGDDGNWIDPQELIDAESERSKGGDLE